MQTATQSGTLGNTALVRASCGDNDGDNTRLLALQSEEREHDAAIFWRIHLYCVYVDFVRECLAKWPHRARSHAWATSEPLSSYRLGGPSAAAATNEKKWAILFLFRTE